MSPVGRPSRLSLDARDAIPVNDLNHALLNTSTAGHAPARGGFLRKPAPAQLRLDAFEIDLRAKLGVPEGEDWTLYLPETKHGDRLFAEWQRLGAAARRASEFQIGAA